MKFKNNQTKNRGSPNSSVTNKILNYIMNNKIFLQQKRNLIKGIYIRLMKLYRLY